MATKNEIQIIIKAVDKATKNLTGISKAMKGLGVVGIAAGAAAAAGIAAVGVAAYKMTKEAASVEKLSKTFDSLADSIGENSEIMIKDLRVASRGMLNDADLMQASNKLVAMGLADTSKESSKLVEMSTQLGSAMGMTATDSAEAFALMLANQSIPRLDNFGISSGVVRDRIAELMEANKDMTRETAFMTATMEEGSKTMEKVGEQGTGAAASMARLQAKVDNLKVEVGKRFLPIMEVVADKLLEMWDSPAVQAGLDNLFDWLERVIGDEESGLIGILTALFSGDFEKGFDMAFGEGSYEKIETLIGYIETLITKLQQAYSDVERLAQIWGVIQRLIVPGGLGRNLGSYWGGLLREKIFPASNQSSKWDRGFQHGGSFIVPGSGSGDRPYTAMYEPGEVVTVTPRNKVGKGGGVSLTINLHSVVSLSDMENAKRVLQPIVESGLRTVMAR